MRLSENEVVANVEQITVRRLRIWVRKGWVRPASGKTGPEFDDLDVARIRLVCELKHEMQLNDEAVPVVLSLMDQLYGIRRDFKALARAIDDQPDQVRQSLGIAWRTLLDR